MLSLLGLSRIVFEAVAYTRRTLVVAGPAVIDSPIYARTELRFTAPIDPNSRIDATLTDNLAAPLFYHAARADWFGGQAQLDAGFSTAHYVFVNTGEFPVGIVSFAAGAAVTRKFLVNLGPSMLYLSAQDTNPGAVCHNTGRALAPFEALRMLLDPTDQRWLINVGPMDTQLVIDGEPLMVDGEPIGLG